MTHPLVSIVITTKNEEDNIENCLISITEQTYPNIEVIVVDNNSTDKTFEIALKFTDKVFNKGLERSTQRNYGMVKIACGKYVMFLDADMILGPKATEACVSMVENEDCVALHIPEFVLGTKYFTRVRRFERSFYNGTVVDGARFFKKSIFVEVGGFDETMSGPEDWDIDKKVKQIGQIGLLPTSSEYLEENSWKNKNFIIERGVDPNEKWNSIFHNESEFDIKIYLAKKKYYSKSIDNYVAKWGAKDSDVRKQTGVWYRFFGVFLERGKWRRLLQKPLLIPGIYLLKILIGLNFLRRNFS
ncbi:MAG: glycosyltransferase [Nitrospina sp.]|nr:glycosyltransferase [Nitrospina sp.]